MALTLMLRQPSSEARLIGQAVEGELADAVDPARHEAAGRQPVDDAAATAGLHRGDDGLRAQQRAAEVHVHHAVPLVERHVRQTEGRQVGHDRGVVDEDVDAAERVDRGVGHGHRRLR